MVPDRLSRRSRVTGRCTELVRPGTAVGELQRQGLRCAFIVHPLPVSAVRSGIFTHVPRILHHNVLDLMGLIGLLSMLVRVYAEPGFADSYPHAIARGFRRRGHETIAYQCLCDRSERLDAARLMELADLHRRHGVWASAVPIWTRLATEGHLRALERLAKYYEHVCRDHPMALIWSDRLLDLQVQGQQHQRRKARLVERIKAIRQSQD